MPRVLGEDDVLRQVRQSEGDPNGFCAPLGGGGGDAGLLLLLLFRMIGCLIFFVFDSFAVIGFLRGSELPRPSKLLYEFLKDSECFKDSGIF